MAAYAFPSELPGPLVSGYSATRQDPILRTGMDAGAPRARRRYTDTADYLDCSWAFDQAEMNIFKWFYEETLNDGLEWFDMDVDVGGQENVIGKQTYECRFRRVYQARARLCNQWTVSGSLELRIPA